MNKTIQKHRYNTDFTVLKSNRSTDYHNEYDKIKAIFPTLIVKMLFTDLAGYVRIRQDETYDEVLGNLEGLFN